MPRALLLVVLSSSLVAGASCNEPEPSSAPPAVEGNATTPPIGGNDIACGLASEPTPFALPVVPGLLPGAFVAVNGNAPCVNGSTLRYQLVDMTGDLQPDMLVTATCEDTTIGPLAWRLYENTGAGFSSSAVRIDLPLPRPAEACARTALVDVDGDLLPDLVTTSLCTDASVGTSRWIVNRNAGNRFDPPTTFTLPGAAVAGTFAALSAEADCANGKPRYSAFDIDGDRKLDLVVTEACDDGSVGTISWRVHKGNGAGFDPTRAAFALPANPAPATRAYVAERTAKADCAASLSSRSYEVVDLDGDYAPEIVVTEQCNDALVGGTRWLAYRNLKNGFDPQPTVLGLPANGGALGGYPALGAEADCNARKPAFRTIDVTGDLRRDLLVTQSCFDPASGVTRWLLFPHGDEETNGALGFAAAATPFVLPPALGGAVGAPLGLEATLACSSARPRPAFFTTNLVQNRFGVVVTQDCYDTSVGTTRWQLYRSSCP